MTVASGPESRLQSLHDLYREGYRSAVVDQALSKLVNLEIEQCRTDFKRLEERLAMHERQAGMRSSEFYGRFQAGELGDDMDLVEWSVFWDMHQAAEQRLKHLMQQTA